MSNVKQFILKFMAENPDLDAEALRATQMLRGRVVKQVWCHRPSEIGVEFEDGAQLFVNASSELEINITGTEEEDSDEPA